jgi:hypothetical protein
MMLVFAIHALSILALVESLVVSLIGKNLEEFLTLSRLYQE